MEFALYLSVNDPECSHWKQECIPVGCVPSAAVSVSGGVCPEWVSALGVSAPGGCLVWGVSGLGVALCKWTVSQVSLDWNRMATMWNRPNEVIFGASHIFRILSRSFNVHHTVGYFDRPPKKQWDGSVFWHFCTSFYPGGPYIIITYKNAFQWPSFLHTCLPSCHAHPLHRWPSSPCLPPLFHTYPLHHACPPPFIMHASPLNRITDSCRNITFPQLRLRVVMLHWTSL